MSHNTLPKPAEGPPYPSRTAGVGGLPTVLPDVPICAVFIACYLSLAITNLTIFNLRRSKGIFFLPQALLGGFCMARVLTCCLRIGWANFPDDVPLGIAASIFVNAGVLIVYIINIIFAQRILRARQPRVGWHLALKAVFTAIYCLIGVALILVISLIVISFYTLDIPTLEDAEWIERAAGLWLLIVTILPLVVLAFAFGLPRLEEHEMETFGHGNLNTNAVILAIGSCLCILIAGFKVGESWSPARPLTDPAWYDSKASFYCFLLVPEVLIVTLYTTTQVYKRFHVPNGSSKRRTYRIDEGDVAKDDEVAMEKRDSGMESDAV